MSQTNNLEKLAIAQFGKLSEAETRLMRAAPDGRTAYCGPSESTNDPANDPSHSNDWDEQRDIRAKLLRWLCRDNTAKGHIDPYGIRIYAARIPSALDLSSIQFHFPLALSHCRLFEHFNLDLSEIQDLDLTGAWLEEMSAELALVRGYIVLKEGFRATGLIELTGVQVGASLECDGGEFVNPPQAGVKTSGTAINAENARITGDVLLRKGFSAKGTVWLMGATIGGNLECWGGRFESPGLKGTEGGPGEEGAGIALNFASANVQGDTLLGDGFTALGKVDLDGAQIGGRIDCDGGIFENPALDGVESSGTALTAENTKVRGDIFLGEMLSDDDEIMRFSARGEVNFGGAQIGGVLNCDGGKFENPPRVGIEDSGIALQASSIRVTDSVFLGGGFSAIGTVDLDGATIEGILECKDGRFRNPQCEGVTTGGIALNARFIQVRDSVILTNGFSAEGSVKLNNARITSRLELNGGTLESLDLIDTSAASIVDDEKSWPQEGNLALDGFVYERISGGPTDAASRLNWLGRQSSFARQPYRQLAKVLRDAGDDEGWRRVCFEMEKRAWEIRRKNQFEKWKKSPIRCLPGVLSAATADYLLRGIIGYGYRSFRAVVWLLLIWSAWALIYYAGFQAGSIVPTDKENYTLFVEKRSVLPSYERFHVAAYSLENSFPLIKLGIQDKWEPSPDVQAAPENPGGWAARVLMPVIRPDLLRWANWVQIGLGWILTTFFAAGVTGLIRRE